MAYFNLKRHAWHQALYPPIQPIFNRYLGEFCQNLSQKILFTAATHFSVKNGRFRASGRRCPIKNRAANGEILHTSHAFVHVFRSNFAPFRVSVSTPNFQKSTPNFSAALTFESHRTANFSKILPSA